MRRSHIQSKLLHQAREPRRLPLGQLEHEPGKSRSVDDRMLQRALEPSANEPGVEGIVAVLDQDCAVRETQERPARVAELGSPDQHRPVDVMALLRIRIYWRPAIDEGVKEGQGARQLESLSAQLEHEERGVARRLDVDGDELRVFQQRLRTEFRRVNSYFLPGDKLCRPARLQEQRLQDGRLSSADRTKSISSRVTALRRMTAAV